MDKVFKNPRYWAAKKVTGYSVITSILIILILPFCFFLKIAAAETASVIKPLSNAPSSYGAAVGENIYSINPGEYIVKSVKCLLPENIPYKNISDFIFLKEGKKFSMREVERTLSMAYSTGYFSNIKVYIRLDKNNKSMYIKLKFFNKNIIEYVKVTGLNDTGVSPQAILAAAPFKKGSQFYSSFIKSGIGKIKSLMLKSGFPEARVGILVKKPSNASGYGINIDVKPGPPVIVSSVFVNLKIYKPEKALKPLVDGLLQKPLNAESIRSLRKNIRNFYTGKGFLNVIVGKPVIGYISKNRAVITINVHPGNIIIFHFRNANPLSEDFIKQSIFDLKDVLIFDAGTFASFQRVLADYLKKQGYYFAAVALKEEKNIAGHTDNVYYEIKRGPRVSVKNIFIKGYGSFKKETIFQLMNTQRTSFFNRDYFRENVLKEDISNIENYFNRNGYLSASVSYSLNFSRDKKSVSIYISIEAGILTKIEKAEIKGLPGKVKGYKSIKKYFASMENAPLYASDVNNLSNLVSSALANSGYFFAKSKTEVKYSSGKKLAVIYCEVKSGPRVIIKNILIAGNTITKTNYIKSLLLFKKGDYYDSGKINSTQNRLYKSGIFNSVTISLENPVEKGRYKTVIVRVKDAKPINFSFGTGYGTYTKYKGFVQLENSNLFGYGKSVSLRFSKSAIYTNLLLNYYDPAIFAYRGLAFNVRGMDTDIVTFNYTMHKEGGEASLIRRFNNNLRGIISYGMFYDFLSGLNPGSQITPSDVGFTRISSVSSAFIYDSRNNEFNPTGGDLTTFRASYSNFILDSQVNFLKFFFHTEEYIPFIYDTIFLYSAKFGYIRPFSPTSQVPINERFFLGGRTSVRGFPQDSIGLVGLNPYGYPIGGDVMENYNLQLNIPLIKKFSMFIFQDGGNVFLNPQDIRPLALYKSAGTGIMYLSPVGPVSFSYGFILNREPYWPAGGVNFTVGTSF